MNFGLFFTSFILSQRPMNAAAQHFTSSSPIWASNRGVTQALCQDRLLTTTVTYSTLNIYCSQWCTLHGEFCLGLCTAVIETLLVQLLTKYTKRWCTKYNCIFSKYDYTCQIPTVLAPSTMYLPQITQNFPQIIYYLP